MRHLALASISIVTLACSGSDSPGADGGPGGDGGWTDASGLPFVCNPAADDNPDGLKPIKYLDSSESVYPDANWRVAIEPETQINWATFSGAQEHESAMLLDLPDPAIELAGFLVSRSAALNSAATELDLAQTAIGALVTGLESITVRVSGTTIQSLDGFDTVVGTKLEIVTSSPIDATELRQRLLPPLLGRLANAVSFPDVGWQGESDTRFIVVLQTLYRAEADQTFYMGAVARALDYEDRDRATGLHADDLSNGSGLTESSNGEARECEDD